MSPVSDPAPARARELSDAGRETAGSGTPELGRLGFRPDVEGLRAVAVGAVLLFHAGLPFAPGGFVGVDVFFVISGFLITSLLVGELSRTGSLSFTRFYARRAKRLLPLSATVLAAVVAASWLLQSSVRRVDVAWDVVASGLYVVNWRLNQQAVDYFGDGGLDSPVQHFWSLAVEEQFYIVWPLLLLAVTWRWRRRGGDLQRLLTRTMAVVGLSSLAYCLYVSYVGAGDAYFSTLTRGWELALGGGLAVLLSTPRRMPVQVAGVLAGLGLLAIGYAVVRFDGHTPFPGAAALVPTLGTAAVIWAGAASTDHGPARLLGTRPVRHVGRISYAWYLWHWPVLVFAAEVLGDLSVVEGVLVAALSWVPAVLSHRLVEQPLRTSATLSRLPARALWLGVACTAVAALLGGALFWSAPTVPEASQGEVRGADAARLTTDEDPHQESVSRIRPEPAKAGEDRGRPVDDGCLVQPADTESPPCVYGDTHSSTTVVMFGDSHMMQYAAALEELADRHGWRLVVLTKAACPVADVRTYSRVVQGEYTQCPEWREATLERITNSEDPELVVTSQLALYSVYDGETRRGRDASAPALADGYERTLARLRGETDAEVAVVQDNPRRMDVPECVSENLDDLDACAADRADVTDHLAVGARAARRVDGVRLVDPTPVLCPEGVCPAVMGDALVYRDDGHLSATFAKTLVPWLGQQLGDLVPGDGTR
jgi:peptidoglycan/LPS O-acetylase OafA/YrhL